MDGKVPISFAWHTRSVRSRVQDGEAEIAEAPRVGDHFDAGDLPVCNRKTEHSPQAATWSPHQSHRSIHQRRLHKPGHGSEGKSSPGPVLCTADLSGSTRARGGFVYLDNHIRIKHGDEPLEIPGA